MNIFKTLGVVDGLVLIGCLAGLVVISLLYEKKNKNTGDVTKEEKNFSIPLIVGATVATFMGASSGMGTMGLFVANGFAGLTPTLAWCLGWLFLCFMAKPLRASGANTLPEFIAIKYSKSTQKISSAIAIIYTMSTVAGQFIACGTVFYVLGLGSIQQGIVVLGTVIIILTLFGGLRGVAITNTIQSVFIVSICVFIIPAIVVAKAGGIGEMVSFYQETDGTKLNFFTGMTPALLIGYVLSNLLCCGAEPSYAAKFLQAKDTATGVKGAYASLIVCVILPVFMMLGAMCLPMIMPEFTDGTMFYPVTINAYLPMVVKGFAMFAFLSLFLTTGNSFLQLLSLLITNDYVKPMMPNADSKKIGKINRVIIIVIGIIAILVGLWGEGIYQVMILGAGVYGAAVFFPLVFGCFSKRKFVVRNINIAMIAGCVLTLAWDRLLAETTGVAGVIAGALGCLAICLLGSKTGAKAAELENKK